MKIQGVGSLHDFGFGALGNQIGSCERSRNSGHRDSRRICHILYFDSHVVPHFVRLKIMIRVNVSSQSVWQSRDQWSGILHRVVSIAIGGLNVAAHGILI